MSESDREFLISKGYRELGCPKCYFLTYVKPDEPQICQRCQVELKTVEECERLILAANS